MAEKNIKCPHCNSELALAEEYMGMEVQCPVCDKNFTASPAVPLVRTVKETEPSDSPESFGSMMKKIARNTAKNAAPIMQRLAEKGKDYVRDASGKFDNLTDRLVLQKYFEKIPPESPLEGQYNFLAYNFVTEKVYQSFLNIQKTDLDYWEGLDILGRFGKNSSQPVAEPQTLIEPVIGLSKTDQMDAKVAFFIDREMEWNLVTNLAYITKIYTFEDQLFVYESIWDYASGCVWKENTQAFFFKDITNISTDTIYGSAIQKIGPSWRPVVILGCIAILFGIAALPATTNSSRVLFGLLVVPAFVFSLAALIEICYITQHSKKRLRSVRRIEEFTVTAGSGSSLSIAMVSKDWLTVKRNLYSEKENWLDGTVQDYTQRSDAEKIIHAIRKMIEEKKAASHE